METLELRTPLPRDEVIRRLSSGLHRFPRWFVTTSEVIGLVNDRRVVLSFDRPNWSNSFQPVFYGKIESEPQGSVITGRFHIARSVRGFMAFWFGMIACFPVIVPVVLSTQTDTGAVLILLTTAVFGLVAAVIAGLGYGILRLGKWLARDEPQLIEAFLRERLDLPPAKPD